MKALTKTEIVIGAVESFKRSGKAAWDIMDFMNSDSAMEKVKTFLSAEDYLVAVAIRAEIVARKAASVKKTLEVVATPEYQAKLTAQANHFFVQFHSDDPALQSFEK